MTANQGRGEIIFKKTFYIDWTKNQHMASICFNQLVPRLYQMSNILKFFLETNDHKNGKCLPKTQAEGMKDGMQISLQ